MMESPLTSIMPCDLRNSSFAGSNRSLLHTSAVIHNATSGGFDRLSHMQKLAGGQRLKGSHAVEERTIASCFSDIRPDQGSLAPDQITASCLCPCKDSFYSSSRFSAFQ